MNTLSHQTNLKLLTWVLSNYIAIALKKPACIRCYEDIMVIAVIHRGQFTR